MSLLELRAAAVTGARWMVGSRVFLQLLSWPITIVVMRLLEPADYGLFALATIVSAMVILVAEFGFDAALIQSDKVSPAALRAVCSVVLALNLVLMTCMWMLSERLADAFGEPGVADLLRWLTLDVAFVALAVVPTAVLERSLRFRALSLVQVGSGIASSLVTLGCALAGLGVWSLVCGALTLSGSRLVMVTIIHRGLVMPGAVSTELLLPLWRVSRHVIASRVLWQWHSQSDQLVMAPVVPAASLGSFSFASQFAMLPVSKVNGTLHRLVLPLLSRLPSRSPALVATHRQLLNLVAIYAVGVCWGIGSVAQEFVLLALGPKWASAALPLAALSAVAPLRMQGALNNLMATSVGQPSAATRELLLAGLLLPLAVYIGARSNGLAGACLAWIVVYPVIFLFSSVLTTRALELPWRAGLRPLAGPMVAGAVMVLSVQIVRVELGDRLPTSGLLAVEVALGALTYLGMLRLVAAASLREGLALAGEFFGRRPA